MKRFSPAVCNRCHNPIKPDDDRIRIVLRTRNRRVKQRWNFKAWKERNLGQVHRKCPRDDMQWVYDALGWKE